jgi:hypothetical protein
MAYMDIFRPNNPKALTTLTTAIQDIKFQPTYLQSLNLTGGSTESNGITTKNFQVEFNTDTQRILPFISETGPRTPIVQKERSRLETFQTYRTGAEDTLFFTELQDVRKFGTENMVERAPEVLARRMAKLVQNWKNTVEYRLLAMINGKLLDSDGSEVFDAYTVFGIARPTEIAFDWANKTDTTGFIKDKVIYPLIQALGGRFPPGGRIIAICHKDFYRALLANPEVRETYKNWEAARQLRANRGEGIGLAFSEFEYGDVNWVDYRGTDDNSLISVPPGKCRLFVQNVPDMFIERWSPKQNEIFVNTVGVEMYPVIDGDPSADKMWWKVGVDNYSNHLCTTPQALLQGRATA